METFAYLTDELSTPLIVVRICHKGGTVEVTWTDRGSVGPKFFFSSKRKNYLKKIQIVFQRINMVILS